MLLRWCSFHLASIAVFVLLAATTIVYGVLVDSVVRSAMGYRLFEYSIGMGTMAAALVFSVGGCLLAFKATTSAAEFWKWRPGEHFTRPGARLAVLWICMSVGSIASGASTKDLEAGFTHMTLAVLAVVPLHFVADTVILVGPWKSTTRRSKYRTLRLHLVQAAVRSVFLLVSTGLVALGWFSLN